MGANESLPRQYSSTTSRQFVDRSSYGREQPGRGSEGSGSRRSVRLSMSEAVRKSAGSLMGALNLRHRKGIESESARVEPNVLAALHGRPLSIVESSIANLPSGEVKTKVYSWGRGDVGQLLLASGPSEDAKLPRQAKKLAHVRVVAMSCSMYSSLAVSSDGQIIGGGDNREGQIQVSKPSDHFSKPRIIDDDGIAGKQVVQTASGLYHSACLTADGFVLTYGLNDFGQLGHSQQSNMQVPPRIPLPHHNAIQVTCSEQATFILTVQGKVFSCGLNVVGTLGLGDVESRAIPTQVKGLLEGTPVCNIQAGAMHVVALSATGKVYSWGKNRHGQLGVPPSAPDRPDLPYSMVPVNVSFFNNPIKNPRKPVNQSPADLANEANYTTNSQPGITIMSIACGENHSAFVSKKGTLFMCGKGDAGQLGVDPKRLKDPRVVAPPLSVNRLGHKVRQVACGNEHTVALLNNRHVFTFGRNSSLQLGFDTPTEGDGCVRTPVHVKSVDKLDVIKVVAGGCQTFLICESGHTDMRDIKDSRTRSNTASPQQDPPQHAGTPKFATQRSSAPLVEFENTPGDLPAAHPRQSANSPAYTYIHEHQLSHHPVSRLSKFAVEQILSEMHKSNKRADMALLRSVLKASLFDMHTLNASFLVLPIEEHLHLSILENTQTLGGDSALPPAPKQLSSSSSGVNVEEAYDTFKLIMKALIGAKSGGKDHEFLRKRLCVLVSQMFTAAPLVSTSDQLRVYFLMLLNPMFSSKMLNEFRGLVMAVSYLNPTAKDMLFTWIEKEFPKSLFKSQLVEPALKCLDPLIAQRNWSAVAVALCRFLKRLNQVNDHVAERSRRAFVKYTDFYAEQPSRYTDNQLGEEFLHWRASPRRPDNDSVFDTSQFYLLQFPFLVSADTKRQLMRFEDQASMYRNAVLTAFTGNSPYFVFYVRREFLLQDTINQLLHAHPYELRKPLRVKFENEDGLDAGGVKKEFFQLLSMELFNPDFGMFKMNEETRQLWFNPHGTFSATASMEDLTEFVLVGALMSLALYNDTLLNVSFPLIIYRWMLGDTPQISLRELKKLDPRLAQSLKQMVSYQGDDFEDVFCQNFEISYDFFGESRVVELRPGGSDMPVTRANVKEYVQAYCRYILHDSIESMARAFLKGFAMVVDTESPALQLFRAEELELLVTGTQDLDFEALEQVTVYEGGFSENSTTVKMFWSLVHSFTAEQKAMLLQFATGSAKAPVGGLASNKFNFKIQRAGTDSNQLPTAHTCFNTLILPDYKSRDKLENRLLLAIENAEGFGLE